VVGIENAGINMLNLEAFDKGKYLFSKVVNNLRFFIVVKQLCTCFTRQANTMWVGTYAAVQIIITSSCKFGHARALPALIKV